MYLVGRKVFQNFSSKNLWRYYGTFVLLERVIKSEHFRTQKQLTPSRCFMMSTEPSEENISPA